MNNYEIFNKKIFEILKEVLENTMSDRMKIRVYYRFLNAVAFNINVDVNSDKDTHDIEAGLDAIKNKGVIQLVEATKRYAAYMPTPAKNQVVQLLKRDADGNDEGKDCGLNTEQLDLDITHPRRFAENADDDFYNSELFTLAEINTLVDRGFNVKPSAIYSIKKTVVDSVDVSEFI